VSEQIERARLAESSGSDDREARTPEIDRRVGDHLGDLVVGQHEGGCEIVVRVGDAAQPVLDHLTLNDLCGRTIAVQQGTPQADDLTARSSEVAPQPAS
jgi:hypothetical protein